MIHLADEANGGSLCRKSGRLLYPTTAEMLGQKLPADTCKSCLKKLLLAEGVLNGSMCGRRNI